MNGEQAQRLYRAIKGIGTNQYESSAYFYIRELQDIFNSEDKPPTKTALTEQEALKSIIKDLVMFLSHAENYCNCDGCKQRRSAVYNHRVPSSPFYATYNFKYQDLLK